MTFTDESMQEFDTYRAWAATVVEPVVDDTPDPDTAPDPEYADMSIYERDQWLDEHAREEADWAETERDRLRFWHAR